MFGLLNALFYIYIYLTTVAALQFEKESSECRQQAEGEGHYIDFFFFTLL